MILRGHLSRSIERRARRREMFNTLSAMRRWELSAVGRLTRLWWWLRNNWRRWLAERAVRKLLPIRHSFPVPAPGRGQR